VEKVWLAAFYMEGIAQQWYYRFERNRLDNNQGDPSWSQFCELVNQRFGPLMRSNPLGELCHLRCTGLVDAYQSDFLTLLTHCGGVTEPQQIAIFTAGLGDPLRIDVELQKPSTLEEAAALAKAFEQRLACDTSGRVVPPGSHTSMSSPASQTTASPPPPGIIRGVEHGNGGRSRSSSSSPTAQTGVIIPAHSPHPRRDGPSARG
jgi:hypothetical protein